MPSPITGGCFCKAVRYSASAEPLAAGHCQCTQCRAFSGTGHSSHMLMPQAAVELAGETRAFDSKSDSGNTVTRHFCPTCGSQVYSLNSSTPGLVYLRASSLDDPSVFHPNMVVFTDSAAPWDTVDAELMRFPRMPPM